MELNQTQESLQKRFYYFRDNKNKPMITVCLLHNEDFSKISRGVSICSYKDAPVKSVGRNKSFGRAMEAMMKEENGEAIRRDEAVDELFINNTPAYLMIYKSVYLWKDSLPSFEKKILRLN